MRIDQLPVASAIGNTDTLPFSDGGPTKQISVGNLTNSIRDNVYGAPLTASTSSAMTDTSRVYVYTGTTGGGFTNGHWYYYNGSAWTDGGIYNSIAVQTDPTLTLEGVPADAKATGELKTVIDDKLAEFDVAVETFYPHDGYSGPRVAVEGTVDAPPAELVIYGKSVQNGTPSPSAPVSIVTAGDSGTVSMVSVAAGANIHNSTTDTAQFIDENGNITNNADYLLTDYIPLSGNYLYIRWEDVVGTACYLRRAYYDSNKVFMRRDIHLLTQGQSGTFWTPLATARYVRICVENSSTNRIYGLKVYNGYGVAVPTLNGLPMPGVIVENGGNYTDTNGQKWLCDTIDLEAGTYTKRCGIVTFDGQSASGWERVNANSGRYRFRNTSYTSTIMRAATNDDVVPMCCTHYLESSANATWTNSNLNGIAVDTGGNIFIADAFLTWGGTLEQFLAQFQTTPMTIVYPLATPVVSQLTEAQLTALRALRSRKGITIMFSTDPVAPEFLAEMYIDIPTYIQWLLHQMDRGFNVTAVNNGLEFTSIE